MKNQFVESYAGDFESHTKLSKDFTKGQRRHGLRWLAGNGADTAFALGLSTARRQSSQSGVCPHPSPTAVHDAGLSTRALSNFQNRSSRRKEALTCFVRIRMSLLTSAATKLGFERTLFRKCFRA